MRYERNAQKILGGKCALCRTRFDFGEVYFSDGVHRVCFTCADTLTGEDLLYLCRGNTKDLFAALGYQKDFV